LNLRLWGVALHHGLQPSYAIIEDLTKRKQDLYRIGDSVAGAATLVAIEWDRVTLERDGQKEFLDLNIEGAPGSPGGAAGSPGAAPRPAPAAYHSAAPSRGIQEIGEDQYVIDRSEVDAALQNMNQLFTQIRAVPHFEAGQATGFRVFAIRQGSIFDKIGLRNGDIIQRINDGELNDPARALALFQELRNEREIRVELIRNRQPKVLTYQLR